MNPFDDSSADDLRPVAELLRARRPEATALELDAVKQQVRRRTAGAPAGRRARSATFMKSRLAILSMLVAGMLLSTTGAGLAVTGLTSSNDASVAQYGPGSNHQPGSGNGPAANNSMNDNGLSPDQGTAPEGGNGGPGTGNATSPGALQPTRQVETGAAGTVSTGGNDLPFTGYLAIPVLLGGVALLASGLVLRRRSAGDRT